MTIQQLRESFAAWREAETRQVVLAYDLIWLLTDPTPITEAGLRELGFEGSVEAEFYAGTFRGWFDEDEGFYLYNCTKYPKTR